LRLAVTMETHVIPCVGYITETRVLPWRETVTMETQVLPYELI
jgi:hypothetical protein